MSMKHYGIVGAYFAVMTLGTVNFAEADNRHRSSLYQAEREVEKQRRDLAKAEAHLQKEKFQKDFNGVRKAKEWVKGERKDLQEALGRLRYEQQQQRYRARGRYVVDNRYYGDRYSNTGYHKPNWRYSSCANQSARPGYYWK